MKIILFAFIISLSLHLLFFINYNDEKRIETQEEKEKKSNIKYVKLIKKEEIKTKKTEPKIDKKNVKPKSIQNKSTKKEIQKKKSKKEKFVQKDLNNKILKEQIVNSKESIQQKTLEDFLSQKEPINQNMLSEIEKLYGREFDTFTKVQKAFLKENLNNFKTITQRVLNRMGYPKLAGQLRLSGNNTVEFIFYPDGSIKNLKITNSSGYEVFDKYTLELIEIAYKDYPKPKTATKLKFNVYYRLY